MRRTAFLTLLLTFICTSNAFPPQSWVVQNGNQCDDNYELVTKEALEPVQKHICHRLLSRWGIVRLDNSYAVTGLGYGCNIEKRPHLVGESLCKRKTRFYSDLHEDTKNILLAHVEETQQQALTSDISPHNVHLVDYQPQYNTYLFRGSNPVAGKIFEYDNLKAAVKNAAMSSGVALPDDYQLIDVSFLNKSMSPSLNVETAFFQQYPENGYLINDPVYGAVTDPNDVPELLRKRLVEAPALDDVPVLVERIRALMIQHTNRPTVLFMHCEAGKDRTGEVSAAYKMYYLKMSYQDALTEANQIANRPISIFSKYGIMWFAYWLKYERGIDVGPIE